MRSPAAKVLPIRSAAIPHDRCPIAACPTYYRKADRKIEAQFLFKCLKPAAEPLWNAEFLGNSARPCTPQQRIESRGYFRPSALISRRGGRRAMKTACSGAAQRGLSAREASGTIRVKAVPNAIELEKAERVRDAETLADARSNGAEQASLRRFVAVLYEHVPPADVAARSPDDLCGAALALWQFAAHREPGRAKVRVYNPELDTDGWSSPHTIVEIVNDDMPFLVDSVTAAVNDGGREVRLVIHPILTVARGAKGDLLGLDPPAGGLRESWMQIEITREPDITELAAIAAKIEAVLVDVRNAVSDWQPMRRSLQAIVAELSAAPPALPPSEIAEGLDFLRWLDDDNYSYLGFREYRFDDTGETGAPLGILRDPKYPVFEGMRDFAALPPDVREFLRRRELLVIAKTNRRATVHRNVLMDAIGIRRFGPDGEVVGIRLFAGLFTSLAYSRSPRSIPLLRLKVQHTMARSGLPPDSHDGKALLHILDTYPRDELFQIREEELYNIAIGILNLQERQRIALFVRRDPLERFVTCLVYVPRDRYDPELRLRFAAILEEAFAGELVDFSVQVDES